MQARVKYSTNVKDFQLQSWQKFEKDGAAEFPLMLKSRRLAGMFADVWQSLPVGDRIYLNSALMVVSDHAVLRVIVTDGMPSDDYGMAVHPGGERFFISLGAAALRSQRPAFVRHVIAHELTHVYHKHTDKRRTKINETQANATAARWGYPESPPERGDRRVDGARVTARRGE